MRGFDLDADDYLVKPFQFVELLTQVRVLLKRGKAPLSSPELRVADLEVDPDRHGTIRLGQRVDLTVKKFVLLM